jgi:hypothetical protein
VRVNAIGVCVCGLGIDLPVLRVGTMGSEMSMHCFTAETKLQNLQRQLLLVFSMQEIEGNYFRRLKL